MDALTLELRAMAIIFQCQHCHKEIKAPDDAGGRRGKCPFCKQSNYIPAPVADEDLPGLAPLDEKEELQRRKLVERLLAQEHDLIAETGGPGGTPSLEQREDLTSDDLHHFVVNYCLAMMESKLAEAKEAIAKLKKFRYLGHQAVEDFLTGKAEFVPQMQAIPKRVLEGFLKQLQDALR